MARKFSVCHPNRFNRSYGLCSECYQKKRREDYKANKKYKDYFRNYYYKHTYNITPEEFNGMARKQNGQCAICQIHTDKLVVDHCHKTEKIRGLLCRKCNMGLGHFYDDPILLEKALQYLRIKNHK